MLLALEPSLQLPIPVVYSGLVTVNNNSKTSSEEAGRMNPGDGNLGSRSGSEVPSFNNNSNQ